MAYSGSSSGRASADKAGVLSTASEGSSRLAMFIGASETRLPHRPRTVRIPSVKTGSPLNSLIFLAVQKTLLPLR